MEDTLELIDLEHLLEDSLHCEMDHSGGPVCSVTVVYRGKDCEKTVMLCANAVDAIGGMRELLDIVRCVHCLRWASECWEFLPI